MTCDHTKSQTSNSLPDFGAHSRPQPRNSGWLAASPQKDLETAHATKFLMFLHVPHRSRIRVPHHRQGGKGFQNMVPDSFCPWRHGPTWSFPFGDHCLIVRSCARAIKLVAKIDKSMTRFQVTVGELEHHDSYCCCSWDWLGEKVIPVAKSI